MKTIYWSSKKLGSLEILVDEDDYERTVKHPWGVLKCISSDVLYVKCRGIDPLRPRKYFALHRFILGIDDPKVFVDHKNGNGLDNRKDNLRISTNRDNCRNRGKQKNNTSGFKGVYLIKSSSTYRCSFYIREGLKRKHICSKTYKSPEEAARKYNELARQYHGEFAYQNPV